MVHGHGGRIQTKNGIALTFGRTAVSMRRTSTSRLRKLNLRRLFQNRFRDRPR
jgi:hypothetical protein